MIDYKPLYHTMLNAYENAIKAIEEQNFGKAKEILICAEQTAEELYLQQEDE